MSNFEVVGVRFKDAGKIYYFNPAGHHLAEGAEVIVETVRGVEFGHVSISPREVGEEDIVQPLKKVVRLADEQDRSKVAENKEKAREALTICSEKVKKHKLVMKLVDAEFTFDNSKIIFYFTADGRVDFRELVKDLAAVFRTRIELRQIGVRDEAKLLGGLGGCGRPLCCATFLSEFEPVSIKMAKEQNLSLNPTKISGVCGRLMCCLRYEADFYHHARKGLPDLGKTINTKQGKVRVVEVNVLKRKFTAQAETGGYIELTPEDIIRGV